MKDHEKTVSELEEEISRFREEVEKQERENELLKFDLDEAKQLNQNLSLEIDRLYQNIAHLTERET
jgi:septation ring formation regulator EzrA